MKKTTKIYGMYPNVEQNINKSRKELIAEAGIFHHDFFLSDWSQGLNR